MNFYRKPSNETMEKRRLEYAEKYEKEIKWLSTNQIALKEKFLSDMLRVLKTGNRPFSEKMHNSVLKSMKNPKYDEIAMIERKDKMKPILEKINRVWELVAEVDEGKDDYYLANWSALPFVNSLKEQFERNAMLSEKQMSALNKVYKKYMKRWENKEK
ncbi:hypothetical protein CL614_03535 [archaeon]|jgi:hypothetical protein|nr:hypothetical protein [archaeon]|tara:strand:- start:89 stop:562 length:474 start_codon:yes stop_codon:yes gene_type:complete